MTASSKMARSLLGVYRFAGTALYPFMGPFLRLRSSSGKEERLRRYERYGYPSAERPTGPLVWFHAASVGESLAVLPLINYIADQRIAVILTTGTVTSAAVIRERLPEMTFHQYVPLDFEKAVQRFLDHWQPDLAIFSESEIWPTTMLEMTKRRIPQVLVNARMSDRSYARWRAAPAFAEALFESISHVIAQSELDGERFRELGARPVTVSGNLKVDTDDLACDETDLQRLRAQIGSRPVWVAASTHAGEEQEILSVHKAITTRRPDLLTVIVPRHPGRGDEVGAIIEAGGVGLARRSRNDALGAETGIFLGDTIGEMGLYLRLGEVTFMGRSLIAKGGQNPLEPAMLGAAILSGPHVGNFRDVYRNLLADGAARMVRDTNNLAENVEFLLADHTARTKMIAAAEVTLETMRGSLDRTVKVLDGYVFPLTVKRDLEGYA